MDHEEPKNCRQGSRAGGAARIFIAQRTCPTGEHRRERRFTSSDWADAFESPVEPISPGPAARGSRSTPPEETPVSASCRRTSPRRTSIEISLPPEEKERSAPRIPMGAYHGCFHSVRERKSP